MPERAPNHISDCIRDTFCARGFFGALGFYIAGFLELLRDLSPTRRKSRYGDIDYDFEHNVDTTWATVSLGTHIREWLCGVQYQASEPELFGEILSSLPVSVDGFTFIDLGSGKGRTLLMASDYPFRRIVGVELLPELHRTARENLSEYKSETQKCFALESICADATEFPFPADPMVLYLFNPFPESGLKRMIANLEQSRCEHPRAVYVLYHNPLLEHVLSAALIRIGGTHQYSIYGSR